MTRPLSSTALTASLIAAASSARPKLYSSMAAAEPIAASGLALPCPAMSGADPCTGSYRPRHAPLGSWLPIEADGSMPIEPARTEPSSLRMSPKRFSVTTTSKAVGRSRSCIAQLSTSMCSSSMSGYSAASWVTTRRQSCEFSSTLALSTEVSLPRRLRASSKAMRQTRSISPRE